MSLRDRIAEIAREEANKAFRTLISTQSDSCNTIGQIIGYDSLTGKLKIRFPDGSETTANPAGTAPKILNQSVQVVNGQAF